MNLATSIYFSLLTDQKIDRYNLPKLKGIYQTAEEVRNQLTSLNFGSDSQDKFCNVCGEPGGVCIGHQAILELQQPVLNPGLRGHFKFYIKGFCPTCVRLSVNNNKCSLCKQLVRYKFINPFTLKINDKGIFLPDLARSLKDIPPADYEHLPHFKNIKFSDMFISKLIILGAPARPQVKFRDNSSLDELTKKLQVILQINSKLRKIERVEFLEKVRDQVYNLLCYQIFTYFDNKIAGLPVSTTLTGKETRSLLSLLESKEGLFRSNLRGKRTIHSARCVITPDSSLNLDEIGVPSAIARQLTKPVVVTKYNRDQVIGWLKGEEGVSVHYYTQKRERKDVKIKVKEDNRTQIIEKLNQGGIIHRTLMKGDRLVFNRQPTLHKYGMMSHKVVIYDQDCSKGLTLRINPSVCLPYNADFDGDESNIHLPQSEAAQLDLKMFMDLNKNYVDSKNRNTVFGITKQLLTAAHCLSKYNPVFTRAQAIRFLGPYFNLEDERKSYTGRQLISLCLIEGFNFKQQRQGNDLIHVKEGQFLNGVLTKGNFSLGSRFFETLITYSGERYPQVLDKMIRLFRAYYKELGHSISYHDYRLEPTFRTKIRNLKKEILEEQFTHNSNFDHFKKNIRKVLKTQQVALYNQIERYYSNRQSSAVQMAKAGSSGTMTHLAQLVNIIGLRTVFNTPIDEYFKQLFPNYTDDKLKSNFYRGGVIWGNFEEGLSFNEFVTDAMYGRDASVNSHLKITTTGYFARRVLCNLSDLYVDSRNHVRDGKGRIIQFKVGGNNIDLSEFRPNVQSYDLKKKIASGYFKHDEDPELPVTDLFSYIKKYHDEIFYRVLMVNLGQNKVFNRAQLERCINYMSFARGTPIGLNTGHAITEPSTQLTLSSKHNIKGAQSSFQRLMALTDRSHVDPQIWISLTPNSKKAIEALLPKKLAQIFEVTYDLQKFCLCVHKPDATTIEKINIYLKTYCKKQQVSIETKDENIYLFLTKKQVSSLQRLHHLLSNIIVRGNKSIKGYSYDSNEESAILTGSKDSSTLYNIVHQLIQKKVLNVNQVTFRDPLYLEQKGGLEETRRLLYLNLSKFIKEGILIDARYFGIYADLVTNLGTLNSSTREGVMKQKPPLTRAAYQATKAVVYHLALSQQRDNLKSPISATIAGKTMQVGIAVPKIKI